MAALNRMQDTGAEVKPEAKPPMGHGRVRVREKEGKKERVRETERRAALGEDMKN